MMRVPAERILMRANKLLAPLLLGMTAATAMAAEDPFAFFEEERTVVSASRWEEPEAIAPVAIEVITAEEIAEMKSMNLRDLLRYRVGVDVREGRGISGNREIVSLRGQPRNFVNNLVILVDGRSTYEPSVGGSLLHKLAVQMQDIERIEIVRGPASTLYGSNAGVGVISIYTKEPGKRARVTAGGAAGGFGLSRTEASGEGGGPLGRFRVSHTRQTEGPFETTAGLRAYDFLHKNNVNLRGLWTPGEDRIDLFAGGVESQAGIPVTNGTNNTRKSFLMARFTRRPKEQNSWEVMAARLDRFAEVETTLGFTDIHTVRHEVEGIRRGSFFDKALRYNVGLQFRTTQLESAQLYRNDPRPKNNLLRAHLHQTVRVFQRHYLTGAVSVEDSRHGRRQMSYLASWVAPVDARHALRATCSEATTLPSFISFDANTAFSATGNFIGNPNLTPQRIKNKEISHRGRFFDQRLETEVVAYYMDTLHHERIAQKSLVLFPFKITFHSIDDNRVISRGMESRVRWRFGPGRSLYATHAYERTTAQIRTTPENLSTPRNKVSAGARWRAGRWRFGGDLGYTAKSAINDTTVAVGAFVRLDARVAFEPKDGIEIFVGGRNLAAPHHVEFNDGLRVPRVFYGGLTIRWEGSAQ